MFFSLITLGAALALAELGDRTAAPVLEEQLRLTSLRVEASEALKTLAVKPDLEPLLGALGSGDEVASVSAAESLVILYGEVQP